MSQEPSTVTYSLEEVLKRIEDKIDKQSETTATGIEKLEDKLDDSINKLEDKLDDSINKLDNRINKLEDKLDEKITKLENKVDSNHKEVTQKLDKQSEEITTIKATLQTQQPLVQKIPDLTEKVGELKNWRQIVFIVVTATVSGLVGWLIRGGALKP
ncbi:MAG: hypothetical protein WBM32_15825 [Crocosphaera sp.]